MKKYPQWKKLIPEYPSYLEFSECWYNLIGTPFDEKSYNENIIFRTKRGRLISFSDVEIYIETPNVDRDDLFIYSGCGCTWSIDLNSNRYKLLDKKTWLPVDWKEEILPSQIIFNYLKNKTEIGIRKERLKKFKIIQKYF